MQTFMPVVVAASVLSLLAFGLIPSRLVNAAPLFSGRLTIFLSGIAFLASVAAAVHVTVLGAIDTIFVRCHSPIPVSCGIFVDAAAVVMLLLISFIGLVIARFSLRYLYGECRQGRFFRWMSFTLGATLFMVISRNLVMFTVAWMMTSFGLHQLLTHYPERTWAIWAARKKFLISRLGDLMLITAVILTCYCFGTTEYDEIGVAVESIRSGAMAGSFYASLIGVFLVLGAMTKSAQFPFHSWLPDTMETPTPVSALMHAGVINAGGFLMIRLSPLVSLSPVAWNLLAIVGTVTAVLGSVVMMTQTSIKRSLAYSTIAQMGFMMLQCGLGAYSSALLHIVAHSAYKAHAFLSCGSVLEAAGRVQSATFPKWSAGRNLGAFAGALGVSLALVVGVFFISGINVVSKPGGAIQTLVLTLALTQLIRPGLASGVLSLSLRCLLNSLLVAVVYAAACVIVDPIVIPPAPRPPAATSALDTLVLVLVSCGFLGIFALQAIVGTCAQRHWIRSLYVHAMNGFYIDIPARRLTAACYGQSAPVQ